MNSGAYKDHSEPKGIGLHLSPPHSPGTPLTMIQAITTRWEQGLHARTKLYLQIIKDSFAVLTTRLKIPIISIQCQLLLRTSV